MSKFDRGNREEYLGVLAERVQDYAGTVDMTEILGRLSLLNREKPCNPYDPRNVVGA